MEYLKYNNIFLSGGAGVGKSFLISRLIKEYRKNGKIVIALGSTGISAFNIGGVTLHSFFRFGRCASHDELYYEDRKQKDKIEKLKRILKQCDLLIIDEISMVSALIMDMIYYRLTRLDFNGKLVVVGDFFQLPPVVRKEQQNSLFQDSYYAFASNAWNEFNFINVKLTLSKRTSDNKFYEYLFYIRLGQINDEIIKYLKSKLIDKNELLSYEDNY
ncbi:AAA family ATPase, partial [Campylobacter volucris]